jgi:hypothetical protein
MGDNPTTAKMMKVEFRRSVRQPSPLPDADQKQLCKGKEDETSCRRYGRPRWMMSLRSCAR